MGHVRSVCGIICILLLLWAKKIQCPAINTQPESTICVLRTQKGVDIRASIKPSLNARHNLHQTLDLKNARCCFNPDKKCALTEHLNVTLNNMTSLLKYPIQPLWMLVNNKRIPHFGVWDELWYSFYEFGRPYLTQSIDVLITRKTSFNYREAFSIHLSSEKSSPRTTHTETSARLVISPHRSPVQGEHRIMIGGVFLLIPEVTGNMKKDSQTRRGPKDYLVLNKSLFEFPNLYCFNEKPRFHSLLDRQYRPCVEASSVDLEKQPYDFYIKAKVNEIFNEHTELFLSSFGTLYDTVTTARHRSSVIFISQQPLILHIFIPNEKPSSRSTEAGVLHTVYFTITLHVRHLGSFLNDRCSRVMTIIGEAYGTIPDFFHTLYFSHLGPFFKDQFTVVIAIIHDGYDVICQNLYILATFLKVQWSSAVGVLYSAVEQFCDILGSFDKFDRISFEKSMDYQWNLIWPYVDHACQKISVLRADGDATVAAGWIAFSIFVAFPVLLVKWLMTSLRNPANVQEMDDIIMMDNDSGTFVFGEEDLLAGFLQDAFKTMCLPPWAGEDGTTLDGINTTMARQDTVPRPSIGSLLTKSDVSLAMAYTEDYGSSFLRLTVSDPCINYNFETGRSISSRKAPSTYRGGSECDVMYPTESLTEIGSVERSRDLSLVKGKYRQTSLRSFSLPCIDLLTAAEEHQRNGDYASILRDCSSCDLMSVTHRETKTSVERPPTTKLAPVLKHSREEPSEEEEGRNLDEACNTCIAQSSSVLKVSPNKKDFRQGIKDILTDIDETYGAPSQPATHIIREEQSEQDEREDRDEAHKINIAPKSSVPKLSQEDKDFKQVMGDFLTDIEEVHGEERSEEQDGDTNVEETHEICMTQRDSAPKMLHEEKDLKQSMKGFLSGTDETYGPPSQLRAIHLINEEQSEEHDEHRDLDKDHEIYMAPKRSFPEMSQEIKHFQQSMKHSLASIDETYGPPSQLRAIHLIKDKRSEEHDHHRDLDEAHKIYMAPQSSVLKMSLENKDFRKSMKHCLSNVGETHGPPSQLRAIHLIKDNPSGRQDEGTYVDNAHKTYMAQKDCALKVSLEDNDFDQALEVFLADIDKKYGKNRTFLRRFTNFLWQCQDATFYVLRIYLDNRFY